MDFPFNYHVSDNDLQVRIGTFAIRKISYSNIEYVRAGYTFWNEHWNNPWPWHFITIRKKKGLFKNFVINPTNRDSFLQEINKKIRQ